MNFPLNLSFKIIALAPQIYVTDATGNSICYVRQKMLKLKESIEVFTDRKQSEKICDIKADRIIDFSATYHFFDSDGKPFGSVSRQGMRSLWKAHYDIKSGEEIDMHFREENPWVKVGDGLFGEIPVLGALSGFLFHPSYIITKANSGEALVRVKKRSAFFESKYTIDKLGNFETESELRIVVATIMMILLERNRG